MNDNWADHNGEVSQRETYPLSRETQSVNGVKSP